MPQPSKLLVELEAYLESLRGHIGTLNGCHETLSVAWTRLRAVYEEGEAAEVFGNAFSTASDRLREYSTSGEQICRLLERKIDQLKVSESPSPGV
jgi:hypothetical protein